MIDDDFDDRIAAKIDAENRRTGALLGTSAILVALVATVLQILNLSTLLACEPGAAIRPMGQAIVSLFFVIVLPVFLVLPLAFGAVMTGRRWLLAAMAVILGTAPYFAGMFVSRWIIETLGLVIEP